MIKAINNYCIVEVINPPTELKKGLITLPGQIHVTPRWAKVLSVGEGVVDGLGHIQKPDVDNNDLVYIMAHGQYSIHKNASDESDNLAAASVLDILVKLKDMNTLKIQPLGNYVEIEKIEFEDDSLIELPDSRKVPTNMGRVISVGPGWVGPMGTNVEMQIKVGDKVVYNPLRTMVIDFTTIGQDEKKFIIQHGDIIGVIEE